MIDFNTVDKFFTIVDNFSLKIYSKLIPYPINILSANWKVYWKDFYNLH